MTTYTVEHWQFIEQRFAAAKTFATEAEAWAYVKEQIDSGKDIGRFRVVTINQ